MRTGALRPWTVREYATGGSAEWSHRSPDSAATIGARRMMRKMPGPMVVRAAPVRPRSAQVQNDGLLLREVLEHRLERGLLAEAGLLHAAIGHVRLHHEVLVHLHQARLQSVAGVERGLE